MATAAVESKTFTLAQVREHNKETDLWIILNDKVYDVTKFRLEVSQRSPRILSRPRSTGWWNAFIFSILAVKRSWTMLVVKMRPKTLTMLVTAMRQCKLLRLWHYRTGFRSFGDDIACGHRICNKTLSNWHFVGANRLTVGNLLLIAFSEQLATFYIGDIVDAEKKSKKAAGKDSKDGKKWVVGLHAFIMRLLLLWRVGGLRREGHSFSWAFGRHSSHKTHLARTSMPVVRHSRTQHS